MIGREPIPHFQLRELTLVLTLHEKNLNVLLSAKELSLHFIYFCFRLFAMKWVDTGNYFVCYN